MAVSNHGIVEKSDATYGVEEIQKLNFQWNTVPVEMEKTRAWLEDMLADVLEDESRIYTATVCWPFLVLHHLRASR